MQPCSSRRIRSTSDDGRPGVGALDGFEGEGDGAMEIMLGASVGPPMMGAAVGPVDILGAFVGPPMMGAAVGLLLGKTPVV